MGKRVAKNRLSSQQAKKKQIMKEKNPNLDDETSGPDIHFLDLPENIPNNIFSRLPLEKIFEFKRVCKKFSKIITDPYFSKVHLSVASKTTPSLIVQLYDGVFSFEYMFMLDLDPPPPTTSPSSSVNAQISTSGLNHDDGSVHFPNLTQKNVKSRSFVSFNETIVGSCNGLVCICDASTSQGSFYCVCNPLLGEYTVLPPLNPSTPDYTYLNHSAFGFCPKSNKYKVIRFMSKKTLDDNMNSYLTTMVEIHTLGTQSWSRIGGARVPKPDGSFDAHLNGSLHWITESRTSSDLICSFDLYTEKFKEIPPPAHFTQSYIKNISRIKIGSLKGCLCVTYISEDFQFTVWVMKDYGVKDSWTQLFSIDINSFTDLKVEDFDHPIKFSHDGDLWLLTRLDSLISYSPESKSFKELSTLGTEWKTRVFAHIPSFISLKTLVVDHKISSMGSFNTLLTRSSYSQLMPGFS